MTNKVEKYDRWILYLSLTINVLSGSSLSVDEASSELSLLSEQQRLSVQQPDHPDDHSPEQPEQQPEVGLGQDQDGLMKEVKQRISVLATNV